MKKILIEDHLKQRYLTGSSFLDRGHIKVITAATNDEMLKVHRAEKVDLIVTQLDMPGTKIEKLFDIIRHDKELQGVPVIIICRDTPVNRERCKQCGINAIFTIPVDTALLHARMQEFLDIAPRKSYRVALTVAVEGKSKDRRFLYHTENISATGMLIKAGQDALAEGDLISLSFYLPDGTHVDAHGEIQRVLREPTAPDSRLYGIKFTDLGSPAREAIEAVVKKELQRKLAQDPQPQKEKEVDKFRKLG
jgi:CheY-like chemotaxis protein